MPAKHVAYFLGGLYAVIHLLQYIDLWTLLILATVGYVLYRHIQSTLQMASSNSEELSASWGGLARGPSAVAGPETGARRPFLPNYYAMLRFSLCVSRSA